MGDRTGCGGGVVIVEGQSRIEGFPSASDDESDGLMRCEDALDAEHAGGEEPTARLFPRDGSSCAFIDPEPHILRAVK